MGGCVLKQIANIYEGRFIKFLKEILFEMSTMAGRYQYES